MTSHRWLPLSAARGPLGTLAGGALTAALPASVCAATFSSADAVAHLPDE